MNRDLWLLTGSVVLTVAVALGMIRWLAPGLLGGPADMQLVQLDKRVPAYYDGVFRNEHFSAREFQLLEPALYATGGRTGPPRCARFQKRPCTGSRGRGDHRRQHDLR